ncbi:MAG: ATP-binding protein [Paracoccaceae bacterium]
MVACLAVMISLSLEVRRQLAALERASSDNVHWVVAQAEVELLRFQLVVRDAVGNPAADLETVRRRFDILFSRVAILQEGPLYAPILEGPGFKTEIAALRGFLDQTVPVIDGPDAGLRAALPEIQAQMPGLHDQIRRLSLRAMLAFTGLADQQRLAVAHTLARLAGLTLALVLALSVLAMALLNLVRRSQAQATENRRTGARLATVVNASVDGIVVTNTDGRIIDFNPAAEAIFGYTRAELMGRDAITALSPPDVGPEQQRRVNEALPRLDLPGAAPIRLEMDGQRADGSRFPVELSLAAAETGADGSIVVGFLRDISVRRRAELALNTAVETAQAGERGQAEFLAIMSHEMRTPLNGMMGSVDLLADTMLDGRQRELVSVLERSGQILLGHVNGVLDIARAEAGLVPLARQPVDLDRLVADCVANQAGLAALVGTRIAVSALSGPLGRGLIDPARLGQVLLNLLGNAVKFTRAGTITVETEVIEPAREGEAARVVEFRVIDSGAGIPQDQLDRIFEDYVTLDGGLHPQPGGTGLGLGISRRLARAMGGEIGAESVVGEGSLFWLRLPLPAAMDAVAEPLAAPMAAGAASTTPAMEILLIEDNAINRFILRSFLESAGHSVVEAVDGFEGVTRAGAQRFDVILTDIAMPGLDGVETTRRIRQGLMGGASAGARILAQTAHALPQEKARFRAAGMSGCLIKPVSRASLLAALRPDFVDGVVVGAGLLDADQLEVMAKQIGRARLAGLLSRLLDEGDMAVAQLEALRLSAVGQSPGTPACPEISRLCHQLAGSAATFGAPALQALLIEAEQQQRRGQTAQDVLAAIPALWQATAAALAEAQARFTDAV